MTEWREKIGQAIYQVVSEVPVSHLSPAPDPLARARELITTAAVKTAGMSGALALPPGPVGLLTLLPDLYGVWRLQAQVVADIAAVYDRKELLTREAMAYCLFAYAAGAPVKDVVVRIGGRLLIQPASARALRVLAERIGVRVGERVMGRALTRMVPLLGAAGVAAYAFYDTRHAGKAAIDLFGTGMLMPPQEPTEPEEPTAQDAAVT